MTEFGGWGDWDVCKGPANCMSEAPEVFHVDEQGKLTVLDDSPSVEKYCPTQAIKVMAE